MRSANKPGLVGLPITLLTMGAIPEPVAAPVVTVVAEGCSTGLAKMFRRRQ
jgi:hypothetical protein